MFVVKLFSSFLIIFSSSLIGYLYGTKYSKRVSNLMYLQQCIRILETEILYGANPLPEALNNVYKKGNKKISIIFEVIKNNLLNKKEKSLYDCFLDIESILRNKLYFHQKEIEVFMTLGQTLGTSNRKDQEKNFKMVITQLKSLEEEAKIEKKKNEKMYKSLGVLTGIAIVIILL